MKLDELNTEQRNENTKFIDRVSTFEAVQLINQEDQKVAQIISQHNQEIADIIDYIWENFQEGRLFYAGAGTSGRLAVVDASECPPTFGTDPDKVVGLIAGGKEAFTVAVEGAEDDIDLCETYLREHNFSNSDILIGIAASGRTPFVIGGLEYANSVGAKTVAISNSKNSKMSEVAQKSIEIITGPEAITGSTRMKAGTSQKLVLNMISSILMIKLGKIYSNLMVDVQPKNEKLVDRSIRIISESLQTDLESAKQLFELSNHSVKHAIVMGLLDLDYDKADQLLNQNQNRIADIIQKEERI